MFVLIGSIKTFSKVLEVGMNVGPYMVYILYIVFFLSFIQKRVFRGSQGSHIPKLWKTNRQKQQDIDKTAKYRFFGMHLKEYIIYREQFKQSIKFGCFLNCGGICIKDKIMQRKN